MNCSFFDRDNLLINWPTVKSIAFINLLFQEVEKYAKLVDSIQYNSQKVCMLGQFLDHFYLMILIWETAGWV